MRSDKGLLWGAWVAMAAAGAFSIYRASEAPKIDPTVARLCEDLRKMEQGPVHYPPGQVPHWDWMAYFGPVTDARPADPRSGSVTTEAVGKGRRLRDPEPTLVLPYPVLGTAKADLDGATLTWSTREQAVELKYWMKRVPAKQSGFSVYRQAKQGIPEKIADLGPESRSFVDVSTEPRKTYLYWVTLTGVESDRTTNPKLMVAATNRSDTTLEVRTPSDTRLKLVGGDPTHAVLRAEIYNRARMAWLPKTVLAAPGETVAGIGWSLNKLRFDQFTLVADVTDDEGVARVLTTRN